MPRKKWTSKRHIWLAAFVFSIVSIIVANQELFSSQDLFSPKELFLNNSNKNYANNDNLNNYRINNDNNNEIEDNCDSNLINKNINNFTEAKRAARVIFRDHRRTFYCGCKYDKHQNINLNSCGYRIQEDARRAQRLEWEHIVPVSHLASHLPCWRQKLCCSKNGHYYGGRNCCRMIDPKFAKMEGDLHNLVPEIGELNAQRANYRFGMLPFIPAGQFGECEIKIDPNTRRVEPKPAVRGTIARTYLYMASIYDFDLSENQKQLFKAWNKEFPPDEWEVTWDQRIKNIQGNSNPYISEYNQYLNY